jgi:hypothetical protein
MHRKFRFGFVASAAIAAMALVGSPLTASADNTTASVGVVAGSLTLVSAGNVDFGTVVQDGTDHTPTASGLYDVSDASGSGAGWNLSISATPFDDGAGNTLPNSSADSASSACDAGSNCELAQNLVGYPLTVPTDGSTATLFDANTATGMGNQTATVNYSEYVSPSAAGGSYSATWTITLSSAP